MSLDNLKKCNLLVDVAQCASSARFAATHHLMSVNAPSHLDDPMQLATLLSATLFALYQVCCSTWLNSIQTRTPDSMFIAPPFFPSCNTAVACDNSMYTTSTSELPKTASSVRLTSYRSMLWQRRERSCAPTLSLCLSGHKCTYIGTTLLVALVVVPQSTIIPLPTPRHFDREDYTAGAISSNGDARDVWCP